MNILQKISRDSIISATFWLIVDAIILTGFGFFFWILAASFYTPEEVGLASTLIAAAELIIVLAALGFDVALNKYLTPQKTHKSLLNTTFTVSLIVILILSSLFIVVAPQVDASFTVLQTLPYAFTFVLLVGGAHLFALITPALIATQQVYLIVAKDLVFSILKLALPLALIVMGSFGLFSSWMLAAGAGYLLILPLVKQRPGWGVDTKIIVKMFSFSAMNYVSNLFQRAPRLVLPILITMLVGPIQTAFFYIAWNLNALLNVIPVSVSKALLAQKTKHPRKLRSLVVKSVAITMLLLLPGIIIVFFLASYLLHFFGPEYQAGATILLKLLAIATLPFSLNTIGIVVQNLQHKLKPVVGINVFISLVTITGSLLFLQHGLLAVGISWLVAQSIAALYSIKVMLHA